MKYDEYLSIVNNIVQTPEKAPDLGKTLLEAIKTDTDTLESQNNKITEQENKIKELRDTNIKLFMSQTGQNTTDIGSKEETVDPHELAKQIMEG